MMKGALIAIAVGLAAAPATGEYVFFAGEPHEVHLRTYTLGEQPHVVCTEIGTPPDLYIAPGQLRYFIETQALTHRVTVKTVQVEIVQQLTLQWIAYGQVMKWWAESETATTDIPQNHRPKSKPESLLSKQAGACD